MPKNRSFHVLDKDLGRITYAETAQRHALRPVLRLGLVVLLLVLGLIVTIGLDAGPSSYAGLAAGLIVAGWLGLAIGSNDVANSLGPAFGAGAIGLLPGLALIALAEVAGASLAGGAVTQRLAHGIFDSSPQTLGPVTQMVMVSALFAAAVWISTATAIGLPVSTSHSIVGGIAGAGLAALGRGAIEWRTLATIASIWVLAPLAAGVLAGLIVIFLRRRVLDAPDRAAAARLWLPLMVAAMTGLFVAYLVELLRRSYAVGNTVEIAMGLVAALIGWLVMRRLLEAELARSDGHPGSKRLLRPPLLVAATIMGFAHGANDVGNIAGPLSVILAGQPSEAMPAMPVTVLMLSGLTIAVGTMLFGGRLVVMVGSGITRLNAGRAFCVSLATGAIVLTASAFGLPVSTTHVAIGGIFGVGFAREWNDRSKAKARSPLPAAETSRRRLVRRSHVVTITTAWVVTVPVAAAIGGLSFQVIQWATRL